MDNFKTFVVVNPHSANGRTGKRWPAISAAIKEAIGPFDYSLTNKPMQAPDLTREALQNDYEMIVAVGGDGNNNEVINGFFDNDKPINPEAVFAIVPGGTGGDLARILGVRNIKIDKVAETLKGRDAVPSDAGKLTFIDHSDNEVSRYFINIASFGLGGEVDAIVNSSSKALGGKLSFLLGGLRGFIRYKNKKVKFSVDDGPEREEKIYIVSVALGQYYGGGMQAAPNSIHNDGLFDIVVFGDFTFTDSLKLQNKIYKGAHLDMPKVDVSRGKKLVATSDETVLLDVDGEQPGRLPATFEIIPGTVRMKQLKA